MELSAAIGALRMLVKPCEVKLYSDSQYLVQTMNAGWKKSKNLDLWAMLDELCTVHSVEFIWVKGHASNPYNNECDQIARAEITKIKTK
jgi:ribonuclease HI